MSYLNILMVLFSGIVAGSTVCYVIFTHKLTKETQKMREAQTEPHIVVYLQSDEDYPALIHLIIHNIGVGGAYDIKFDIKPDFEYDKGQYLSQINIFKNGINYLAPNQKIKFFLVSMIGRDNLKNAIINFKVKYKNCFNKVYNNEYILEFSEFYGMRRIIDNYIRDISRDIKDIKEYIRQLSLGERKIRIITYTLEDHKKK